MVYPWIEKGHKVYKGVLFFQAFLTLFIGYFTDTLMLGLVAGIIILALPLAMMQLQQHSRVTCHAAVIATQLFAALHIQQYGGTTYMHFEIFAVMAMTTLYRDWTVVVSSVAVVALHHISFYIMQSSGMPVFIFEELYLTFYVLIVHALFAIAEGIVLGFMAIQSKNDGASGQELTEAVNTIMAEKGTFNLHVKTSGSTPALRQFEALINAFSEFIEHTKSVAGVLDQVSQEVGTLSKEVKQASTDTTGQVATIAAATEEMTVNNDSVASRANEVNTLSLNARDSSIEAKTVVVESNGDIVSLQQDLTSTSSAISQLSEKCQQIEDFMASIKAISEQTNLLALNAAIESARAGEHGRGFAVVADEVRQLAMRTKENTEQISEITAALIHESTVSVQQMKGCVEKSGKVSNSSDSAKRIIDTVVSSISSVTNNMTSVAEAIREQSQASAEISKSTSLLANTSEALSLSADHTEQSFSSLGGQIAQLQHQLSRFK
ncbi:methyl-accepting chemotaxis protein [Glaciecola sp. 1036]|uniref:methyl-accepting chemotaxis protein n=1 Tax=Alteromonadaceae TaxID=72275 RepID=UPI003D06D1BF